MFVYATLALCVLGTVSSDPVYGRVVDGPDGYRSVQGFVISGYDIPSGGNSSTMVCAPSSCDPKSPLPPGASDCTCVGNKCHPSFGYPMERLSRYLYFFSAMCNATKGCQAASVDSATKEGCAILKSEGSASALKTADGSQFSSPSIVISKQLAPVVCTTEVPVGASCTLLGPADPYWGGNGAPTLISPVITCCEKPWLNYCSDAGKCVAKGNTGGALAGR